MNLTDGLRILKKAADLAADVAMAQPGIKRRVQRVQSQVDALRREAERMAAEIEARAQEMFRDFQEEAMRAQRQLVRQRTAVEHYHTLGLAEGASLEDVKKAYRRLMRQHHPDKHSNDAAAEGRAHARAQQINQASGELTALLTGRENRRGDVA